MRSYHYHLNAGKEIRINMETTPQGWIILNRFVPDYLNLGYGNSFVAGQMNTLESQEFAVDCQRMVECFNDNRLDYRDSQQCYTVLNAVVGWHIKKYGRIIFGDLMTYTSEMCELMYGMGYDESTLKLLYPNFVAACVAHHLDYIKESLPSFTGPRLLPFKGSQRFYLLDEKCPRLSSIPKI